MVTTERVIAYIDGFNLYFGMIEEGRKDTLWLNIQELAKSLLKPHQQLIYTKYFTSRVANNPDKERRQKNYIEAIETLSDCKISYGKFQPNMQTCKKCSHSYSSPNEKMTDVNIAVEMLSDAYVDRCDTAMLISGDSDLIPPIREIHKSFKNKRVFVAFPPNRYNSSVAHEAKGSIIIGKAKLKAAQFPATVTNRSGFDLTRPKCWI